jgi:hypothetical protein
VTTATSTGERHRERELAQGQVPGLLEHLLLHLEPVPEQDQDQGDDRQPLDEVRGRVEVEQPEAALAEQESGHHEGGRERQEAAARDTGDEGAEHQ